MAQEIDPERLGLAVSDCHSKHFAASVDFAAETRDLALADAVHPHCLDQIVDRTGRYALDVGLLDHRGQCLLGHPSRLQKAREVAAFAQLGDG